MNYSISNNNNKNKINMNYFYKSKKKNFKNKYEQLNLNYNLDLIQKRMSNKEKKLFQLFWPKQSFKRITQAQKFNKEDEFKKLNANWIKFYNN